MHSSGTCFWIVASQVRWDQKTCAFQLSLLSSAVSTLSTFFMKLGNSPNWVHWLYATRIGTPTSIDSTMFIALVALSAPPPPPPPPDSFSLSPENRPLTAPPAGDLPSAFAVVARSAAEPIGLPLATPSSLSVTSDILSRTVPRASSPLPERAQAALRVPRVGLPPRSSLRPPLTRPRAPRLAALHPARTGPRAPLRPVRPPRTGPQSPPRRLRHQLPRTGPRALQRHPRTRPGPPCRRASSHRACVACRSACQCGSWPPRPPLPWPRRMLGREVRSVAPKAPDCSGRDRRPL